MSKQKKPQAKQVAETKQQEEPLLIKEDATTEDVIQLVLRKTKNLRQKTKKFKDLEKYVRKMYNHTNFIL